MITTEIDDNCTIFRVTGQVTANDIVLKATDYLTGERQTATSLWDFTGTEKVKITTTEMKGIADSLKSITSKPRSGKPARVALVASRSVNIGLGKIFAAFAQIAGLPFEYKIFRELSPAVAWLHDASQ